MVERSITVDYPDPIDEGGRDLFMPGQVLAALRDSRYQSTAYAIAELIDNSIEAGARHVDLLCQETDVVVRVNTVTRVDAIAVADSGSGMSPQVLIQALRFGGHVAAPRGSRISKYGVGLPASSVSQCRRVDVWTWQTGLDSAWWSYLDVGAVESGEYQVPIPISERPPEKWLREARQEIRESDSGTLVVWSNLDRLDYRTFPTIVNHVGTEAGRIYRHFIHEGKVSICMRAFNGDNARMGLLDEGPIFIRPNDPLYLMANSATPSPWNEKPMFEPWGNPVYVEAEVKGRVETIEIRYSIVAEEGLTPGVFRPGNLPHGQHAARNVGISVVREDRELVVLPPMVRGGNEMNRWWGCEVRFGQGCDDLFGVDHSKQMASRFALAVQRFARETPTADTQMVKDSFAGDDELLGHLYELVGQVRNSTRSMLETVEERFKRRSERRTRVQETQSIEREAEVIATEADREELEQGRREATATEVTQAEVPPEQRSLVIEQVLVEEAGYEPQEAKVESLRLVEEGSKYKFIASKLDGSQMFSVRPEQGVLMIRLNFEHRMYDLLKLLEEGVEEGDERLKRACLAIRLLICSWASMEDNIHDTIERQNAQFMAIRWGRQAETLFASMVQWDSEQE